MAAKKSSIKANKTPAKASAKVAIPAAARRTPAGLASGTAARKPKVSGNAPGVDVGDRLPDVELEDQQGKPFRLSSLRGRARVVYFYPKDDTPGCTREACAFQEQLSSLARLGATVVGISPDPRARHAKFAEKYGLQFTLLVDENREYAKACGVLGPKTLYGKTSIGIVRTTFLVDGKGVIRHVWRKVKVDGHVDQVLAALRDLERV